MWDAYKKLQPEPGAFAELPKDKLPPTPGLSVGADEVDKQALEIRARRAAGDLTADLTVVLNADVRYRYRGINKNPQRVARAQALGFEIVPADDPARWPVNQAGGKEFGDQILMREPIEVHHAKVRRNNEKAERQTRQKIDDTKDAINRIAREARAVGPHVESAFEE